MNMFKKGLLKKKVGSGRSSAPTPEEAPSPRLPPTPSAAPEFPAMSSMSSALPSPVLPPSGGRLQRPAVPTSRSRTPPPDRPGVTPIGERAEEENGAEGTEGEGSERKGADGARFGEALEERSLRREQALVNRNSSGPPPVAVFPQRLPKGGSLRGPAMAGRNLTGGLATTADRADARHSRNPSLETILNNMYSVEGSTAGVVADGGRDSHTAQLASQHVSGARSGVLAPRDYSAEREQRRSSRGASSGVLAPRDWGAEPSGTTGEPQAQAPPRGGLRSGQLAARDFMSSEDGPSAVRSTRNGLGTLDDASALSQQPPWAGDGPSQDTDATPSMSARSRSGQLAPRGDIPTGGAMGAAERFKAGPRSMATHRSKDVHEGDRQQKGAAQRRLGRANRQAAGVIEEDSSASPSSSSSAVPPGRRLGQDSISEDTVSKLASAAPPARPMSASERLSASLAASCASVQQGQKVAKPMRGRDGPGDNVLQRPFANVREKYQLQMEELGRGRFGVIRLCFDRASGAKLACKSISKARLKTWQDADDVRKEVTVMELLEGHPHVVSLKGAFEDALNVHLVMELCEGGELFDRITAKKRYSEPEAAIVCRTVVGVLRYCHALGFIHRDLKPENILLCAKDNDTAVKVIDFGVATSFKPGEPCREEVGTPFYLAPEVLLKNYGPEADIWSAGVVLYILLCGVPPFWGKDTESIRQAIREGQLDLTSGPWKVTSDAAKDLVAQMLTMEPRKRIKGDQILAHPWIVSLGRG
eukprot:TRINITY_DN1106_c0_g1_i1.p1 TRINITY_DN1106_c0_g1~~TRINITY_DN1106_c0_g1_i1.p1  ORF type:complete len:760 (+),score=137.18 TRINITY_DN1106_c0_g1_i1:1227-3506(+)